MSIENQSYTALYSDADKLIMKTTEDSLDRNNDRIAEIVAYCNQSGIKNIGIANCITFQNEADKLETMLVNNGFMVNKAHCKLGKVAFNELLDGYKGVMCNPAGQAAYLAEKNTELNIMMGLCLGHDMIFNSKSKAPVTPLIVKDRKLKHNTLQILAGERENK